jgi:hypothetical protein
MEGAKTSLANAVALDLQAQSEVSAFQIAKLQMHPMSSSFNKLLELRDSGSFFFFSAQRVGHLGGHLGNSYYWHSRLLGEWPKTKLLAIVHGDMGILSFMDLIHSIYQYRFNRDETNTASDGILLYYANPNLYVDGEKLTRANRTEC